MTITEKDILNILSTVQEPDLKKDLVTLNMVQNLVLIPEQVSFTVILTTPACPLKELIRKMCTDAIHQVYPNLAVVIDMKAEVTSVLKSGHALSEKVKNVIAIASGKGGVGKSTVTANLAVALSRLGAKVGILDADISGPSIPLMFGVENERPQVSEVNGKTLILPIEKFGIKLISMGFLSPAESAIIWRGPMASKALTQFLVDTDWGNLDYLLIDLPPGTGDIHLTLVQIIPLTGVVIVTTPQKVALADATKGLAMFRQPQINVDIMGVVENMAYFTPAELPNNQYYIFGKDGGKVLADKYEVPFLGEIPLVQSIREGGDRGIPIMTDGDITAKAFEEVAQALAQQVAIKNAKVDINTVPQIVNQ